MELFMTKNGNSWELLLTIAEFEQTNAGWA